MKEAPQGFDLMCIELGPIHDHEIELVAECCIKASHEYPDHFNKEPKSKIDALKMNLWKTTATFSYKYHILVLEKETPYSKVMELRKNYEDEIMRTKCLLYPS